MVSMHSNEEFRGKIGHAVWPAGQRTLSSRLSHGAAWTLRLKSSTMALRLARMEGLGICEAPGVADGPARVGFIEGFGDALATFARAPTRAYSFSQQNVIFDGRKRRRTIVFEVPDVNERRFLALLFSEGTLRSILFRTTEFCDGRSD